MENKMKKAVLSEKVFQGVNTEITCHVMKEINYHWLLKDLVSISFLIINLSLSHILSKFLMTLTGMLMQ